MKNGEDRDVGNAGFAQPRTRDHAGLRAGDGGRTAGGWM